MKWKNLKLTTNKILIVVAIAGLLITQALSPDSRDSRVIEIPPAITTGNNDLPLPPARPRKWGINPFDRPFLFQLGGTDKLTAMQRENMAASQYRQILAELNSEVPEVEVRDYSSLTIVTINDKPFVTVLPSDCPEYYSRLSDDLRKQLEHQVAVQWRRLLIIDLTIEASIRSPGHLASYPYIFAMIFFLCLLLHVAADAIARRWLHSPGWALKIIVWLAGLSGACFLHPVLKPLAATVARGALRPVFMALYISILMNLLYHLGGRILEYYVRAYQKKLSGVARQEQRLVTMAQGARFLVATMAIAGGLAWFLVAVGVPVEQFFAGAGIAGIALGVIGRDILIDYFYGINILLEDQFSIGDWIETDSAAGSVVSFNLRTTHIRQVDGSLAIVTNGMFKCLKNHSREWANADFRIGVAYGSNPDRCLALIAEEIEGLAEAWPEKLEKNPALLGVHQLGDSSIVLRALVKTSPLAQWEVGRELNRRVLLRFERERVEIPFPQRKIWIQKNGED